MEAVQTSTVHCPNCGESIEVVVDCSIEYQEYTEDCSVCCRPIIISVLTDEFPTITVRSETE